MPEYYGDIDYVIKKSGIEPQDLFLEEYVEDDTGETVTVEEQLNDFVEKTLKRAKSYIDYDRNREFDAERPLLVDDIAERIAVNMLDVIVRDQTSQITDIDNFNYELIEDVILTNNIRKDLNLLPRGTQFKEEEGKVQLGFIGDLNDEEQEYLGEDQSYLDY